MSGDLALIDRTGKEKQIVGVTEIVSQPDAEPALHDTKRIVVDIWAGAE